MLVFRTPPYPVRIALSAVAAGAALLLGRALHWPVLPIAALVLTVGYVVRWIGLSGTIAIEDGVLFSSWRAPEPIAWLAIVRPTGQTIVIRYQDGTMDELRCSFATTRRVREAIDALPGGRAEVGARLGRGHVKLQLAWVRHGSGAPKFGWGMAMLAVDELAFGPFQIPTGDISTLRIARGACLLRARDERWLVVAAAARLDDLEHALSTRETPLPMIYRSHHRS